MHQCHEPVPEQKKGKKMALIEVIYSTMDGNVYFLDIEDGSSPRGKPSKSVCPLKAPARCTPPFHCCTWARAIQAQGKANMPAPIFTA